MLEGRQSPRHADTQENVDSVAPGDVADRGVGMFIAHGSHFTCECIWRAERKNELYTSALNIPKWHVSMVTAKKNNCIDTTQGSKEFLWLTF